MDQDGQQQIQDAIERAFRAVPRDRFLPADLRHRAAEDAPLPIGDGQTNSQPTTVRNMLALLEVQEGHRVLDLGAGSGWTTALLAHLVGPAGEVIGVERQEHLLGPARSVLTEIVPDARARIRAAIPGELGAPKEAPFDRILVSAGAQRCPPELVDQLGEEGVMVIPIQERMLRVARQGEEIEQSVHGAYRFVPLIEDPP